MDDNGFIYILINPAMPGLVKIGKTTREPEKRINELSQATGVPTPFILIYSLFVHDCTHAENYIHTYLSNQEHRVSEHREFFSITPTEAINIVLKYQKEFGDSRSSLQMNTSNISKLNDDTKPWLEIEKLAIDHFYGNNAFRDYKEALKLFKNAIKLGSVVSYRYLGEMYRQGQGCKADYEKSLQYFKDGTKQKDLECYGYMMAIYSHLKEYDNFLKCWHVYIKDNADITIKWCVLYLNELYNQHVPLRNWEKLIHYKEEILKQLDGSILAYAKYLFNNAEHEILLKPNEYQSKRHEECHNALVTGKQELDACKFCSQDELFDVIKEKQRLGYNVHPNVVAWLKRNNLVLDKDLPLHLVPNNPK